MVKSKIVRGAAAVVASAGLAVSLSGVAGASPSSMSGYVGHTGPSSSNVVASKVKARINALNRANLTISKNIRQTALSGNALVTHNTTGGSARTGSAGNSSTASTAVRIANTAPKVTGDPHPGGGSGTIDVTGPNSDNSVTSTVKTHASVRNLTNITATNNIEQNAVTGDALVSDNTNGGDAVTGNASNTSNVATTIEVVNN